MALYDYFCLACRNEFDLVRPMSEALEPALCPICGSEARRTMTGAPAGEVGTAAPPVGMASASDPEHRTHSGTSLPGDTARYDMDHRRSAGGTTAIAVTAPEEGSAAASGVSLSEDTTPLELPQIADCRLNGSNLWHIRDWGIASMFGYLRDKTGTATADSAQDRRSADHLSPAVPESGSHPSDADAAGKPPSASEWRMATSVMPWLKETAVQSPEGDQNNPDTPGEETDLPGLRPGRNRPIVHFTWARGGRTKSAQERRAEATRRRRPEKEEADAHFPSEIIEAAWRRQGGRCACCGRWLVWSHRNRDVGTGAWESHHRIPPGRGGRPTLANCLLLCAGIADCHFNVGHGGVAWSHYAPVGDSALLFLSGPQTTAAHHETPPRRKRNLLREVFGIPESRKG